MTNKQLLSMEAEEEAPDAPLIEDIQPCHNEEIEEQDWDARLRGAARPQEESPCALLVIWNALTSVPMLLLMIMILYLYGGIAVIQLLVKAVDEAALQLLVASVAACILLVGALVLGLSFCVGYVWIVAPRYNLCMHRRNWKLHDRHAVRVGYHGPVGLTSSVCKRIASKVRSNPQIRDFTIWEDLAEGDDTVILQALSTVDDLQVLGWHLLYQKSDIGALRETLLSHSSLRALSISSGESGRQVWQDIILQGISGLQQLEYLSLGTIHHRDSSDDLFEALKDKQQLRTVRIACTPGDADDLLERLAPRCPKLQSLDIEGVVPHRWGDYE